MNQQWSKSLRDTCLAFAVLICRLGYSEGNQVDFGNGGGLIGFAMMEPVQVELGIDQDDQTIAQIRELSKALLRELRNVTPPDRQTATDAERRRFCEATWAIRRTWDGKLRDVLSAEQLGRLKQIYWQRIGPTIYVNDDTAARLELRDEQKKILASIDEDLVGKAPPVNIAEWNRRGEEILSRAQRERVRAMKGARFTFNAHQTNTKRMLPRLTLNPAGRAGLALIESVQKELRLTENAEGIAAIRKVSETVAREIDDACTSATMEGRNDTAEMYFTIWAKHDGELKKHLTDEQYDRLRQIHWQTVGPLFLSDPEIIGALELSQDQRESLEAMTGQVRERIAQILDSQATAGSNRLTEAKKSLEDWNDRATQVLTIPQREKLAELKGRAFVFEQTTIKKPPVVRLGCGMPGVALREPVLKELGIAGDVAKIEAIERIADQISADMRVAFQKANDDDRKEMEPAYCRIRAKYDDDLRRLLTVEQWNRLWQIHLQFRGPMAFADPEIITAIGITAEQSSALAKLTRQFFRDHQKLSDDLHQGRISDGEFKIRFRQLLADFQKQIDGSLTPLQHEELVKLKGPLFGRSDAPTEQP